MNGLQDFEECSYKDLQKIAKEYGIPANQKKDVLIAKIKLEVSKKQQTVQQEEKASPEIEIEIESQEEKITTPHEETKATVEPQIVNSPQEERLEESKNLIITQNERTVDDIIPSPTKAEQISFYNEEDEEEEENGENGEEQEHDDEQEYECEYGDGYDNDNGNEENADPLENRLGGKLLGIATPTGQKKLFQSPAAALTKSGQKIYDKYSVHWRYEDYDQQDPSSLITPQKSSIPTDGTPMSLGSYADEVNYEDMEQLESPEKRLGSDKLLGLPTPNGKSIYFLTPKDKSTDQYNVHWRYEDYLNEDEAPPAVTSHLTTSSSCGVVAPPSAPHSASLSSRLPLKSTTTPRSNGKFKFVHAHP